jgi:hypothetical protein
MKQRFTPHKESPMNPRVIDNDKGEIAVSLDGKELRGWSYTSDDERRQKMLQAREYVEGWCDAEQKDIQVKDLCMFWQGRANALRILDSHRSESDGATLEAARIYEECAKELAAAMEAKLA